MNTKLTPEQLNSLRCGHACLVLEGVHVSWEDMLRIGEAFYASDEPEELRRIGEEARRTGKSQLKAITELYGPPGPRKDPSEHN